MLTEPNLKHLNMDKIWHLLSVGEAGCRLFYKEEVDSTNEWAKREAAAGEADGAVYLADYQSAGKGRRGRVWQSPAGTSISMSLLLRPGIPVDRTAMLTLVMGLAAAEGMANVSGLDVKIKWPNDVTIHGKKLCGILAEMGAGGGYLVIGIGINVNMEEFPEEVREIATSLRLEKGEPISREAVIAAVLESFFTHYRKFLQTGNLKQIQPAYEALLANRNCEVRVLDPVQPFEGTALGIDEEGQLLVKRADDGQVTAVFAGEVSVRGIYGYV